MGNFIDFEALLYYIRLWVFVGTVLVISSAACYAVLYFMKQCYLMWNRRTLKKAVNALDTLIQKDGDA